MSNTQRATPMYSPAIMNSSYESVKVGAALEAMHEKASIIQDVERFWLPSIMRRFDSVNVDDLFPSWLHILMPSSLDEETTPPQWAASPLAPTAADNVSKHGTLESCEEVPSQENMLEQWDNVLRDNRSIFKKTAKIHAIEATANGSLTVVEGASEVSKPFEKGDYILCGPKGDRYTMRALDFAVRYDCNRPQAATNAELAEEGFQLYQATNRIWALKLTVEQVETYFPALSFIARQVPSFSHAMCAVNVLTNPRFAVGGRR